MSKPLRIYDDDELIKYKTTEVSPERTRHEIDGILAEYEVRDVYWHGVPKNWKDVKDNEIYVMFKIEEIVDGKSVLVSVRVDCPTIWHKPNPRARRPEPESVNWAVSMRAMHWFIYTHLNASYAMQSGKAIAFLGYILNNEGRQLKSMILPRLREYQALEDNTQNVKVIEQQ